MFDLIQFELAFQKNSQMPKLLQYYHFKLKMVNLLITRQVFNLFQDLWNRFPSFEGWGVGANSLGVKAD